MYKIIAVSHRRLCPGDFLRQAEKLAQAGCPLILREKDLSPAAYQALAARTLALYRRYGQNCILHFYPQAARALGAKGLHLPLWRLREEPALAEEFTVGVSVHSLAQAREGEKLGAVYLAAGHIFPTACKAGLPPRGLDFLQEICREVSLPVYAIGGITPENAPMAIRAGAAGVCVMSGLMQAEEPEGWLSAAKKEMGL